MIQVVTLSFIDVLETYLVKISSSCHSDRAALGLEEDSLMDLEEEDKTVLAVELELDMVPRLLVACCCLASLGFFLEGPDASSASVS